MVLHEIMCNNAHRSQIGTNKRITQPSSSASPIVSSRCPAHTHRTHASGAMLVEPEEPQGQTATLSTSDGLVYDPLGSSRHDSSLPPKWSREKKKELSHESSRVTILIILRLVVTKLKLFLCFVLAISTTNFFVNKLVLSCRKLEVEQCEQDGKHDCKLEKRRARSSSKLLSSEAFAEPGWGIKLMIYLSYGILICFGYLRNFCIKIGVLNIPLATEQNREGYPPLYKSWQGFFTEHIYRRVSDIFHQPIGSNPGGIVKVFERISPNYNRTFMLTGRSFECINLASYDYLGLSKPTQEDERSIVASIREYSVGVAPTHELGVTSKQKEVETLFAQFLGVEDAIIFGMGFATNACNIQALVAGGDEQSTTDCLFLSDSHNHNSIRLGVYLSRASFDSFRNNNLDDLEKKLRRAIIKGNPKTGNRWRKIIIIVEGVYSMEGTIVDLPRLIELKKRYKCCLYIDEAHSIGAVGPNGRGVVDYFGCDPNDVDVLMGTMTKTFAAAGGYIAGRHDVMQHVRRYSAANYGGGMAAPVAQQIINKLVTLTDDEQHSEGRRRIGHLLENTHYMREQLKKRGFIVYGNDDSPVVPIMAYFPSAVWSIVRSALREGVALVAAGYPATSLATCRIRLCMTAAHSRETLDKAIEVLSRLGDIHQIKYAK